MKRILFFLVMITLGGCCEDPINNCPCFNEPTQHPFYRGCGQDIIYDTHDACASVQAMYKVLYQTLRYPAEARENSIQGTVLISFDILTDGTMTNFEVVSEPLGYGLEEAAFKGVYAFSKEGFCPARENCEPIIYNYTFPVKFRL